MKIMNLKNNNQYKIFYKFKNISPLLKMMNNNKLSKSNMNKILIIT